MSKVISEKTMVDCRPRNHLTAFTKRFPNAWKLTGELVRDKGQDGLPDWPSWCFLPMAGSYAVMSAEFGMQSLELSFIKDVATHAAMAAWRLTQGIYRFDPAVYESVRDTSVEGDIPHDVLFRLPEWCIYIETPGMQYGGDTLYGFFVHLEHDANTGQAELRLLLDLDDELQQLCIHLGPWSLKVSIERMLAEANVQALSHGLPVTHDLSGKELAPLIEPLVSLVLYVCTQAAEIGEPGNTPVRPHPKKTKKGLQYFPVNTPKTWNVGVRMGAALRKSYQVEQNGTGAHSGPRPHIRRAHWHGYRIGPRTRDDGTEIPTNERGFDLRWLPPIAVNLSDVDDLPTVVRPVT